MQPIKDRLLRGGKWALGGTLLSSILGLTINALLARLLSVADLGLYFLLVSFVALSATLAQAGVLSILLRRIALSPVIGSHRGAVENIKSASVYVGIGLLVVSFIVLIAFDYWLNIFAPATSRLGTLVFLIILWIGVFTYQGVVTESFRGLHDIRNAILFGGAVSNTLLITAFGLLLVEDNTVSLVYVIVLVVCAASLSLVLGFVFLSRQIVRSDHSASVSIQQLKSMGREAIPLLVSGLLMIVLSQGDLWLVGLYLDNEDVALYGAAIKLAILTGMPLNLINAVLPPYIAQLHATGQYAKLEKLLSAAAAAASIPAVTLAGISIFAGEDLLGYLYGEHYRQAAPLFAVLCVGHLVHVLLGSGSLVLMLTGNGNALMVIASMSSLLLVVGGIAAASFGTMGIALSAAFALVFQKALMWKWIRLKLGITIHAKFDAGLWRMFWVSIKR